MNGVDIGLVVFAALLMLSGWRSGFVRAAGSLLAFFVSIGASFYGMNWLHETYDVSFSSHPWLTIGMFFFLVVLANRLAKLVVEALDLIRKVIAIIPFVNTVNSLLGAALGLCQAGVGVLVFAYLVVSFVPVSDFRTLAVSSRIIDRAITFETSIGLL